MKYLSQLWSKNSFVKGGNQNYKFHLIDNITYYNTPSYHTLAILKLE